MIVPSVNPVDAIEAAIAASPFVEIVFPAGTTNIDRPIVVPNSKAVRISGEAGALVKLTSTAPGDCIFKLQNDNDSWVGSFVVTDLSLRAKAAAGQSCFGTDQADRVNLGELRLENLTMSSTGYDVRFDNQEYTIAPTFRNLRGNNGIYWSGAAHAASNLLIENCRFQSGTRGPQIYIYGARNWTIRNNICEGSVLLDADVDPNANDVRNTRGVLLVNPGPANGTLDSQWIEYWATLPSEYLITIAYTFINGGANKCGTYTIKNTDCRRLQVINTSTTDEMTVAIIGGGWALPDFGDASQCKLDNRVNLIVSGGGTINRKYRFDNPKVKIESAVAIMPGFNPIHYQDRPSLLYAYKGGTGIYNRDAKAGNWNNCRPYVQHHPKHGHSVVIKATTKLDGTSFLAPLKTLGSGLQVQEVWACCPHLELTGISPTSGGSYGAGALGTIGVLFQYEAGHSPKRYIGMAQSSGDMPFFRCVSLATAPTSGKWLQIFTSAAWRGGFGDSPSIAENYDCYEWPNEPGPPLGTSIAGDVCRAAVGAWQCTEAGTSRPIQVTGNAVKGVAAITGLSDITELLVGDFLDIAGATGVYRVIDIVGDVVTLDKKIASAANLTGAIVTNHTPTWTAKP